MYNIGIKIFAVILFEMDISKSIQYATKYAININ